MSNSKRPRPVRNASFRAPVPRRETSESARVREVYAILHAMPEPALQEVKTSEFLANRLKAAGYTTMTGVAGTGVIGSLHGARRGPVLGLRADMDALKHNVDGQERVIHSCGHDAHSAMVLCAAERAAARGLASGTLKILFQPAEEILRGAIGFVDAGAVDDVDALLGIHLRPKQEASKGQATPALCHGASGKIEITIDGVTSHAARPHLGTNAIDAAAAVVNAINAIRMNPVVPFSIKVTRLHAGGAAANIIPDRAEMVADVRAQTNELMDNLLQRAGKAIANAAASVGAGATIIVKKGAPAAEYSEEMIGLARKAIVAVLGETGLIPPITTPGAEDFHFYVQRRPSLKAAYIGLGCDLTPGLHHPAMKFDIGSLIDGVRILENAIERFLGFEREFWQKA